jgi:hypothetical protein
MFIASIATALFITTLSTVLYRILPADNTDPTAVPEVKTETRRTPHGVWVATLREKGTGRTVHTTKICRSRDQALREVEKWAGERETGIEIRNVEEGD